MEGEPSEIVLAWPGMYDFNLIKYKLEMGRLKQVTKLMALKLTKKWVLKPVENEL